MITTDNVFTSELNNYYTKGLCQENCPRQKVDPKMEKKGLSPTPKLWLQCIKRYGFEFKE